MSKDEDHRQQRRSASSSTTSASSPESPEAPVDEPSSSSSLSGNKKKLKFISYTSSALYELGKLAPSKVWPDYLDEGFKNPRDKWDPDRWHQNRKRGNTPPPLTEDKAPKEIRREVKDRLKAEQDGGIILSPQRGSFLGGCQVQEKENSNNDTNNDKQDKMNAAADESESAVKPNMRYNRRDEEEYPPHHKGNKRNAAWQQRDEYKNGSGNNNNKRDMHPRRAGARFPQMRRDEKDNEPEWMTAPVAKGEMMELRGFDESPEKETKKMPPIKMNKKKEEQLKLQAKEQQQQQQQQQAKKEDAEKFNFDDFLNMDSIPGLANILNDDGNDDNLSLMKSNSNAESKFSKFFKRNSPPQQPQIRIPSPTLPGAQNSGGGSRYTFAPISPAAKTEKQQQQDAAINSHNPLMDLLKGGSAAAAAASVGGSLQGKNVKSVEELEAEMSQMGIGTQQQQHQHRVSPPTVRQQQQEQQHQQPPQAQQHNHDDDMSAFKKFAALVDQNKEPSPLPQVNNNTFRSNNEIHPGNFPPHGLIRPAPIGPSEQELLDMQQQQQQQQFRPPPPAAAALARMMHPMAHMGPPPPMPPHQPDLFQLIAHAPSSNEVLQRPEVRSLNRALASGEVTPGHLLEQFTHGNLPTLQREILLNVLKVQQNKGLLPTRLPMPHHPPPFPPPVSRQPPPPNDLHISQRISPFEAKNSNNLAVSPTPPGQQRVPSPQELQYHAQQIMQNALIKRKLEEQKENYRKRQEDVGLKSESPLPSQLTFTPTAVMKKLAADRRDSNPQIPELRVDSESPTKLNNAAAAAMMAPPVPLPPPNPLLLIQHQQNMAQQQMQQPPGGLSRFFSPEVLAQAQSGQAPSMPPLPTQAAMTLEELECQAAAANAVKTG